MRIDWQTLALQTINVLILIWILAKFLFRPVAALLEERRGAAAKVLDDAEATKREAMAARERAEAEAARIAAGRDSILRQAAADADAQHAAALAAAQAEVEQIRAAAEIEMRGARATEEAAVSDRAARLAVDIAARLMSRLPNSARIEGFVDGLVEALRSLPEGSRARLATSPTMRLIVPRPLDARETQMCRDALTKALGLPVEFVTVVDPSLIAGVELETPHAVARNSFRADLNRIVEDLTGHDRVSA